MILCLDLNEIIAITAVVTTNIIEINAVAKITFRHRVSSLCNILTPSLYK